MNIGPCACLKTFCKTKHYKSCTWTDNLCFSIITIQFKIYKDSLLYLGLYRTYQNNLLKVHTYELNIIV